MKIKKSLGILSILVLCLMFSIDVIADTDKQEQVVNEPEGQGQYSTDESSIDEEDIEFVDRGIVTEEEQLEMLEDINAIIAIILYLFNKHFLYPILYL